MKALSATGIFHNDFSGLKICIMVLCIMPPCGLEEGTTISAKHASSIFRATIKQTSTEAEGSCVKNVGTHYTDWILSYWVSLFSSWGYSEEVQI